MTPEHWRRVKDLFDAALAREPAARAGFVAGAAADDLALADEVLRLVALDEKASGFLSAPADAPAVAFPAGRRIGPYRVLGEIGRGGMGAVLRAVRDDDQYQKEVAIKLVRGGLGPDFVVERFKAERQILATLEHANIAHLIDGGSTDEGWPWFAMECVEGRPIDQFCAARGLSIRGRLELFRTVCSAVQYAHQRLVVHRDLKPSNILVTEDGIPKLLDFGIAKLLGAEAAVTRTAFPLMTPEYASPEQMKGEPITTAADVYSLGMLLYEMLAGRRGYELSNRSPQEIARVVCEVEPPPPSAVAPRETARQLAGDLDTIVLKTIRKEPERRYASVQEMSEDLRRHLAGLPVLARADASWYRTGKFLRRHKAGVAAAALAGISLVAGIAATMRQAGIAEANRARAERRFQDVRKLANAFLFDFHDAISDLPGSTNARKLVVENGLVYLESLSREAQEDTALQRELAVAYERLGDAQGGPAMAHLGDTKGALASYEKARAIRRALELSAGEPRNEDGVAFAALEAKLGRLLAILEDWPRAEVTVRSARKRMETLSRKAGSDLRLRLANIDWSLAYIQTQRGEVAGAQVSLERAASLLEGYGDEHPGDGNAHAMLARVRVDLAERFQARREYEQAAKSVRSARAILERLVAAEPNNARYRRDLIHALSSGSDSVEQAGDLRAANDFRRRALELAEALVAADPRSHGDRIYLTYARQGLGKGLVRAGQAKEGLELLRGAVKSAGVTVDADPTNAFARSRLFSAQAELGLALHQLGMHNAEMCDALERSARHLERRERDGSLPDERRQELEQIRAAASSCPDQTRH